MEKLKISSEISPMPSETTQKNQFSSMKEINEEIHISKLQILKLREISFSIHKTSMNILNRELSSPYEATLEIQQKALNIIEILDQYLKKSQQQNTKNNNQINNLTNTQKPRKKRRKAPPPVQEICKLCGCTREQTTQWRRGPDGYRSLCNACGLRYASIMKKEEQLQYEVRNQPITISMLLNNEDISPLQQLESFQIQQSLLSNKTPNLIIS
jgi:hypothetical protein